jgi:hypothetical protein
MRVIEGAQRRDSSHWSQDFFLQVIERIEASR